MCNEILLWRHVIKQMAQDAFGYSCTSYEKAEALQWFFDKPQLSLRAVCDLADLNADYVKDCMVKALMQKDFKTIKQCMRDKK